MGGGGSQPGVASSPPACRDENRWGRRVEDETRERMSGSYGGGRTILTDMYEMTMDAENHCNEGRVHERVKEGGRTRLSNTQDKPRDQRKSPRDPGIGNSGKRGRAGYPAILDHRARLNTNNGISGVMLR